MTCISLMHLIPPCLDAETLKNCNWTEKAASSEIELSDLSVSEIPICDSGNDQIPKFPNTKIRHLVFSRQRHITTH